MRISRLALLLVQLSGLAFALPQQHQQPPQLKASPPLSPPILISSSNPFPLSKTNTTTTNSPPSNEIICFEASPHRYRTTVTGCRPTLNEFRTYPEYARRQTFREAEYGYPRLPHPPPYVLHQAGSDCAILLGSDNEGVMGYFSFKDARTLATEIIEYCQDAGGFGGSAAIGPPDPEGLGRWAVTVMGTRRVSDGGADGGIKGSGKVTGVEVAWKTMEAAG
ncbi:MAG: hypothetical protein Q9217_006725 [Psora testacea]